ncbi:hypothetical protein WOLCODRAFT_105424 [Wolfiporia cocos MD-104 SS10]|uniref:Uncharacterized protein n=1 Tax=Wolfiporia cocos (strain MD-104) TaxID=742152 RepID=A0A2H3JR45_WOLCO|nr:hypothetical protein WOLCODRAFT_105424 [Wolfiporia cocos MD-104 SS10]
MEDSIVSTAFYIHPHFTCTYFKIRRFCPLGEQSNLLRSVNDAIYIGGMAWGLNTAVFYLSISTILHSRPRYRWLWMVLVSSLWAAATVNIACIMRFNELAWIDNPHYRGGANAFYDNNQKLPVNLAAAFTVTVNLILADGFLMARCHVMWRKLYVSIPLGLVYLAALAFAIMLSYFESVDPTVSFWISTQVAGGWLYKVISGSLHTIYTILILSRLIYFRRNLPGMLTHRSKSELLGATAMLVESAVPYSIISIVWMVLSALWMFAANIFTPLLVQLQSITVGLIVIRIATGRAWSLNVFHEVEHKADTFRDEVGDSAMSVTVTGRVEQYPQTRSTSANLTTMTAPPPSAPSILVPEIISFVPQFLLDDIINIANDATRQAVDAMEAFLERRDAARDAMDDGKGTEDLERGLNSFQTLLESHVDIAFDFFEAWSLRNIFVVPADLPVVVPHHNGLDFTQPEEKETELLSEIKDLRKQIQAQRKLRRLYTHAVRMSAIQLAQSRQQYERISFLNSPQLKALVPLSGEFHQMYTAVSSLPSIDPSAPPEQSSQPEPGKRQWETSKRGYINWAIEQLMMRAKDQVMGNGTVSEGSSAIGATASAAYSVGSAQDIQAVLENTAGKEAVSVLATRNESNNRMDTS